MCLAVISEPPKKVGVGYKILRRYGNKLLSICQNARVRYEFNKWARALEADVTSLDGTAYIAGFHIYTDLSEATTEYAANEPSGSNFRRDFVLVRVEYQRASVAGYEANLVDGKPTLHVVVARRMRPLEIVGRV